MTPARKTVTLIGALPPPVGGVTIHISQLASALAQRGFQCEVVDTMGARPVDAPKGVPVYVLRGNGVARVLRLSSMLRRDDHIHHFHISQGASFFRACPLLLGRNTRSVNVCTIHSGAIGEYYSRLGALDRAVLRWSLRRMTRIVSLSTHITSFLLNVLHFDPERVVVSGSFLGAGAAPALLNNGHRIRVLRDAGTRLLITSGCRQPLYRYEEFIAAVERLRRDEDVQGIIIAYEKTDSAYWDSILRLAADRSFIHLFGPMPHDEFMGMLSCADVYVRCTSSDSCGVAIHEALSVGTAAVATDVCERADGTVLFPQGDLDALVERVRETLSCPPKGLTHSEEKALPSIERMVAMYESLGARPQGERS